MSPTKLLQLLNMRIYIYTYITEYYLCKRYGEGVDVDVCDKVCSECLTSKSNSCVTVRKPRITQITLSQLIFFRFSILDMENFRKEFLHILSHYIVLVRYRVQALFADNCEKCVFNRGQYEGKNGSRIF